MDNKYGFKKYAYFSRWVSYWHQIDEILKLNPKSLLIIGAGDNYVVDILKRYIKEVKTLDIAEELDPDYVSSVENMPISDKAFDIVLCSQVLEHLPFNKFEICLKEIKRVAKSGAIISLPHFGPPIKFSVKLPFLKETKFHFKLYFPLKHQFNGEHYWEIGKKGFAPSKIRKLILKFFTIKKEFIPFENQYHHFYILKI